jgi:8-oxo-dGTP diphosphatase
MFRLGPLFDGLLVKAYRIAPRFVRRPAVRWMTPNYTVGVACLLVRPNGDVLLVRQTYRNGWALPGGLLNRGEDPTSAAEREVREELGLDVRATVPHRVAINPVLQTVTAFVVAVASDADVDNLQTDPTEITEVRWFSSGALPSFAHDIEPVNDPDVDAMRLALKGHT